MKKRRKVIIIIIVSFVVLLINHFRLTGNVLDRIGTFGYYALPQFEGVHSYSLNRFWYDEYVEKDTSTQRVYYGKNYLREGEYIYFYFYDLPITDIKRKNVEIRGQKYIIPDTVTIHIEIEYDYARRTIIYKPIFIGEAEKPGTYISELYYDEENIRRLMEKYSITEEDIREFQEYVLYDIVLKSWKGATFTYNLEKWKLQRCRVEDLTFEFE